MSDLRLLPSALTAWLATVAVVWGRSWLWGIGVCAVAGLVFIAARRQAVVSAAVGLLATFVAGVRTSLADGLRWPPTLTGESLGTPTKIARGWMLRVKVEGVPGVVTVFARDEDAGEVKAGDQVVLSGRAVEASAPSVVGKHYRAETVTTVAEATGWQGWSGQLKADFVARAGGLLDGPGAGLLPAMVAGDTSGQSAADKEAYLATGLAHLSAVSGGNVAIVSSAAVIVLAALGAGPRVRIVGAGLAIAGFAAVVGPEPSILRASLTGAVSLVAMLASTKAPPIHALCLAVIGLVVWDSDLAVSFGFALSVAATAGIIVLTPWFYRGLARLRMPDILTRAAAVAVAAELSTMPLVALVAERVSAVGVVANMLVAPVVAPITILGLAGFIATALPGGAEAVFIEVCGPLVGFVGWVAHQGARWPAATISVPHDLGGLGAVALVCCWLGALLVDARPRLAGLVAVGVLVGCVV